MRGWMRDKERETKRDVDEILFPGGKNCDDKIVLLRLLHIFV